MANDPIWLQNRTEMVSLPAGGARIALEGATNVTQKGNSTTLFSSTNTEVNAGTNNDKFATPVGLATSNYNFPLKYFNTNIDTASTTASLFEIVSAGGAILQVGYDFTTTTGQFSFKNNGAGENINIRYVNHFIIGEELGFVNGDHSTVPASTSFVTATGGGFNNDYSFTADNDVATIYFTFDFSLTPGVKWFVPLIAHRRTNGISLSVGYGTGITAS